MGRSGKQLVDAEEPCVGRHHAWAAAVNHFGSVSPGRAVACREGDARSADEKIEAVAQQTKNGTRAHACTATCVSNARTKTNWVRVLRLRGSHRVWSHRLPNPALIPPQRDPRKGTQAVLVNLVDTRFYAGE